jgi:N-hydroxyarylamine O-acetyltransferase
MTSASDLAEYLARVGLAAAPAPTAEGLAELHHAHATHIPFENLDVLLGRTIRLDPASLHQKLVRDGRGGYCFEQNLLLHHALTGLGFAVVRLAARVVWNRPPEAPIMPLTHALLRVSPADLAQGMIACART